MADIISLLNKAACMQEEQHQKKIQAFKEYLPSRETIAFIHSRIDDVCGKILRKDLYKRA